MALVLVLPANRLNVVDKDELSDLDSIVKGCAVIRLSKSKEMVEKGSSSVRSAAANHQMYKVVCDERCPVVNGLAGLLQNWDTRNRFVFVDRNSTQDEARELISELDRSDWSLLLVDGDECRYEGPEAIPMILKNLPAGRIFVVFYLLPGTMFLTRAVYHMISQSRKKQAGKLVTP